MQMVIVGGHRGRSTSPLPLYHCTKVGFSRFFPGKSLMKKSSFFLPYFQAFTHELKVNILEKTKSLVDSPAFVGFIFQSPSGQKDLTKYCSGQKNFPDFLLLAQSLKKNRIGQFPLIGTYHRIILAICFTSKTTSKTIHLLY